MKAARDRRENGQLEAFFLGFVDADDVASRDRRRFQGQSVAVYYPLRFIIPFVVKGTRRTPNGVADGD